MVVTFPHMGTLHVVLRTLLERAGTQVLVPPPTSKRTLELGVKYSPEAACLPFKIGLGNFIEALEGGADTILTCGGTGPCRLGYYAAVQQEILADLGFRFEMVAVEPEAVSIWRAIRRLTGSAGWRRVYDAFRLAESKLAALDRVERTVCFARPRMADPQRVEALRQEAVTAVDAAAAAAAVAAAEAVFARRLAGLPAAVREDDVPRVGLVGEIYLMLDGYANHELVRRLGHLGVEVRPTMLLGDYVRTHVFRRRDALGRAAAVTELARPYLGHFVGGHGIKSVGHTVEMGRAGIDGMIHVFPFTCMPEAIAMNVLPAVNRDVPVPVLSLACDEMTGAAGLVTRLEAFADLLRYRRAGEGNRRTGAEGDF